MLEHFGVPGVVRNAVVIEDLGERMDASRIETLKLCPKKYQFRYEMALQPKGHTATAAEFGGALHAALATYYLGNAFDAATCPCDSICEFCADSSKLWGEEYQGYGKPLPMAYAVFLLHYPTNPESERDNRTRHFGLQLIYEYIKKYGHERDVKVLAVEQTFILPYPEFNLIGRIDVVLETPMQVFARDVKSTSRVDLLLLTSQLSTQMGIYLHALSTIFNKHISTEEIDAISTARKSESDRRFSRHLVVKELGDLELDMQEVMEYYEQIKRHRKTGLWPRSAPFACTAYNMTCEYYPICYSKENPDTIANSYERIDRRTI